jgi:hypothetical protein
VRDSTEGSIFDILTEYNQIILEIIWTVTVKVNSSPSSRLDHYLWFQGSRIGSRQPVVASPEATDAVDGRASPAREEVKA